MSILTKYINTYLFTFLLAMSVNAAVTDKSKTFSSLDTFVTAPSVKTNQKNIKKIYTVKSQILLLKKLSEHDIVISKAKYQQIQQSGLALNKAEQYLMYLVQANIAHINKQDDKTINWVNKAIELEPFISDKQLDSPDFASAYRVLVDIYQKQENYQAAFDSQEKYIKKYFDHLTRQTELRVKRLNEKYEVAKKHEENKLLEQSSELKRFELNRIESQKNQQNINIAIIVLAGVLLFLLLFRQFKILHSLRNIAKTDSLTKLANRKALFAKGDKYMEDALKDKSQLCVLMIDIDHLQHINDTLGDSVGDKVICHVAGLASETMRSRDVLARVAGEEFAAILPDASINQAKAIAERIREKIQGDLTKEFNYSSDVFNLTVSIGLASIEDGQTTFYALLHAANIAMYHAKEDGCNKVHIYDKKEEL